VSRAADIRVLHIGPDSQFLQFAARTFESVAPGSNDYIVVNRSGDRTLQYPPPGGEVVVAANSMQGVLRLLRHRPEADVIIAHSMTPHAAAVFSRATPRAVTVWSGWGYDYYGSDAGSDRDLFGPLTRKLVDDLHSASSQRPPLLRRALAPWHAFTRSLVHRAAGRADFFSAPVPTDEPVFRSRYPEFHGAFTQLSYASLEETFTATTTQDAGRSGILVGNSATPSNNHLEAFELLAQHDLGPTRVVVPLSYGDPSYRDAVVAHGARLLGDAFVPLVERLPLEEYNALVGGCGVVIVNTRRQQALGNIGMALQSGAQVILDEVNPVYAFLRREDVAVCSTSELRDASSLARPLGPDAVARNRDFVKRFWGEGQVKANATALLTTARQLLETRGTTTRRR